MQIKRDIYLNKLILRKHNGMIKVITGIRRCGKSFLLFNLFKEHLLSSGVDSSHIIQIAFDDFENKTYRDPNVLYPFVKSKIKDDKMYYILLDEVQLLEEFEDVLNGFLRIPNVDIYVTGSNAKFLSKDVITEFRGRGDQVYITPLLFSEFITSYGGDKYQAFADYMIYGGLPMVCTLSTHEQKDSYLKSIFEETYIKDIIHRHKIKNSVEFRELLDILSSSIGSPTSISKLTNTFKSVKKILISKNTIQTYIEYLEDSFLVQKANRYDVKGKKYIDSPCKYYFSDIGLRNACLNFRQDEDSHAMENIIYNELIARGYSVDVGIINSSEKNKNNQRQRKQLEIDFVCNMGSRRIYIQSALSVSNQEKLVQEQKSLLNINDSFKKIIIVKDIINAHYNEDGILLISIYDFLLNHDIINY